MTFKMALIKHLSWILLCISLVSLIVAQEDTTNAPIVSSSAKTFTPPKTFTTATAKTLTPTKTFTTTPSAIRATEGVSVNDETTTKDPRSEGAPVPNDENEGITTEPPATPAAIEDTPVTTRDADIGQTQPQSAAAETEPVTEESVTEARALGDGGPVTDSEAETTQPGAVVEEVTVPVTDQLVDGVVPTEQPAGTQASPEVDVTQESQEDAANTTQPIDQGEEIGTTEEAAVGQIQNNTEVPVVGKSVEPVTVDSRTTSEVTTAQALLVDLEDTTDQGQLNQTISDKQETSLNNDTILHPTTSVVDVQDFTTNQEISTADTVATTEKDSTLTTVVDKLTTEEPTTTQPTEISTADTVGTTDEDSTLTTVVDKLTTEEPTTTQPTEAVVPSDDPCDNIEIKDEEERHLSHKRQEDSNFCDSLEAKWYGFKYQDQWAEIPSVAIKQGYCGAKYPFRLDLSRGDTLPELNETKDMKVCAASVIEGELDECILEKSIRVKRCADYFIYHLQPLMTKECMAAVCTQLSGEEIPAHVLANSPPQAEIISTTEEPLPINQKSASDLNKKEQAGAVTIISSYPHGEIDRESFLAYEKRLSELLAKYLNENPPESASTPAMTESIEDAPQQVTVAVVDNQDSDAAVPPTADFVENASDDGQNSVNTENKQGTASQADPSQSNGGVRRRRDVTEEPRYTADSIIHIEPTPRITEDGKLEMAIIVKDKDGNVVPAEILKKALENMENPSDDPEIKLEKVTVGLPVDMVTSPMKQEKKDIWDAHMGLWITIIVLCAVCLITLIICCVCFRCCDTEDTHPEKSPLQMEEGKKSPSMVIENPLPDEEIMRDEAPMLEHENPALTSNGGGQHLAKDEDNGWIVPLEQLTDADKQKADVENTKL